MILTSAATAAGFLQGYADLGTVSSLECKLQLILWLAQSSVTGLQRCASQRAQQEQGCLMGKSAESCLLASSNCSITAATVWAQLGLCCNSLHRLSQHGAPS